MRNTTYLLATILGPLLGCVTEPEATSSVESAVRVEQAPNRYGIAATISLTGDIDRSHPFFTVQENGRSCETCHDTTAGWSVTPELAQQAFGLDGTAPLFKPFDGSVNPEIEGSTPEQRRALYDLLLRRGVNRYDTDEQNPLPENAEFVVVDAHDPYGYSTPARFARYRRPTSIANERFAQTLLWHGFEAPARALLEQVSGIASGFHNQHPISPEEQAQMADFMDALIHAQVVDKIAGPLNADGARGGVAALSNLKFKPGLNDPTQPDFDPNVFTLYTAWRSVTPDTDRDAWRLAIARGEQIFNGKPLTPRTFPGVRSVTCSTCHAVPNIGNHPVFRVFDIGTADPTVPGASELPQITVQRLDGNGQPTGSTRTVTDLGHALVSGRWRDIGTFAVPRLRGLASRAPYFHDGSARTLREVVDHYEARFHVTFTAAEKKELIAFLSAL